MDPVFFALAASCMVLLYFYLVRHRNYWKNRNVPHLPAAPLVGNVKSLLTMEKSTGVFFSEMYNCPTARNEPYLGFFAFNCQPALLIRDPGLAKKILVEDFGHFNNRCLVLSHFDPVGSKNLFSLRDNKWKWMRTKLTPIFTSGKMKQMFLSIKDLGAQLQNVMDEFIAGRPAGTDVATVDVKDIIAKYTTDVITACAFGINANSMSDPQSKFRFFGKKVFETSFWRSLEFRSFFFMHSVAKMLRLYFLPKELYFFMKSIFVEVMEHRVDNKIFRNDFFDLLFKLKNDYELGGKEAVPEDIDFSDDDLIAQATVFYTAGFETTATTVLYALYELSQKPELQDRMRREIIRELEQEGTLNYESLQRMKLLDNAVSETLRMYPAMPFLDRVCTRDYKVPDSDLVIEKGTPVYFSLYKGLHYDPKYFRDPNKFDPDRFNEENKTDIPSYAYIPFGGGPRICIGMRFGVMSSKFALALIISRYKVEPSEKTVIPVKINPRSFLLAPESGMYLNFSRA